MQDATPDKLMPYCTCITGAFAVLVVGAGVRQYKVWKSELRGKSSSSNYQEIRLVFLLIGFIVVLGLFSCWIQLLVELIQDRY